MDFALHKHILSRLPPREQCTIQIVRTGGLILSSLFVFAFSILLRGVTSFFCFQNEKWIFVTDCKQMIFFSVLRLEMYSHFNMYTCIYF